MNKELIKKYKAEFDHWLDGGTLLARKWVIYGNAGDSSYTIWYHIDSTFWEAEKIFSTSLEYHKTQFIINDEYIEFRIALAEGKVVEFSTSRHLEDIWHTLETPMFNEDYKYRIKPDKPKFKAGDWVKYIYNMYTGNNNFEVKTELLQISIAEHDVIKCTNGSEFIIARDSVELWQPQPGEWCWFWYTNCNPILAKYINNDNEDDEEEYIAEVYTNDRSGNGFTRKDYYTNCEPFIGTLPSFLHD